MKEITSEDWIALAKDYKALTGESLTLEGYKMTDESYEKLRVLVGEYVAEQMLLGEE